MKRKVNWSPGVNCRVTWRVVWCAVKFYVKRRSGRSDVLCQTWGTCEWRVRDEWGGAWGERVGSVTGMWGAREWCVRGARGTREGRVRDAVVWSEVIATEKWSTIWDEIERQVTLGIKRKVNWSANRSEAGSEILVKLTNPQGKVKRSWTWSDVRGEAEWSSKLDVT